MAKKLAELLEELKDQEWKVRRAAIVGLSKLPKPDEKAEAVPEILSAVEDEHEFVRREAITALGKIGQQAVSAMPVLLESLVSPDHNMRRLAAVSIGFVAPEQATKELIEALQDEDGEVRNAVQWALRITGPDAVAPLIEALSHDSALRVSGAAIILGKMGPIAKDAIPKLMNAISHEEVCVRKAAARAIGEMGTKEVEVAVSALINATSDPDKEVQFLAAEALRKIGTPEAMKIWKAFKADPNAGKSNDLSRFIEELADENRKSRLEAARALGKAKDPEAVPALIDALQDDDEKVRNAAAIALEDIGTDEAVAAADAFWG